jgi:hypothetical protein
MFKKAKILFISTAYLALNALSVHAMDETDTFRETRARLRRTGNHQQSDLYVKNPGASQPTQPALPLGILEEEFMNTADCSSSERSTKDDSYTTDDEFSPCNSPSQNDPSGSTKEKQHVFKDFDMNSREFQNVVNGCKRNPDANKKNLVEYFEYIPPDHKIPAVKNLESELRYTFKLDSFKYTTKGEVVETPSKLTGIIPLRDKLTEFPGQSEAIDQNSGSVLSDFIDELEEYHIELALQLSCQKENSPQSKEIFENVD